MIEDDLDVVLVIEEASFSHPWSRNLFREELARVSSGRCLVAEMGPGPAAGEPSLQEATICGYITAWLVADEVHITNLAVAPPFRGRGVARAMLRYLMDRGVKEGVSWWVLEVRESNRAARSLYEGLGFRIIGHRRRYYQDGEDAVVMGKEVETEIKTKE